ncbi:hypothetical protein [Pseudomonas sp. BIGb0164]|uniref:hypothetical protein n=1 Tax=Pseudomonas sp. BIGb0164 TaxID=2940605 RepID=UPI002169C55F|nr:hypothetical protein [Pseudomonas sp. BIGb0164]MCS4249568.1 hypothetical protein [Pseudomonas sp. BIGb0164]
MLRIAAFTLLATLCAQPAFAEQTFDCAGASVTIGVDPTLPLLTTESAEVLLRVKRGPRETLLRYYGIDSIGGACDTRATGGPRIVYQAVCNGSGCHDLSNWGVINPQTLQVLLIPADDSLEPATRLLGHPPALEGNKMNVSQEAHRLGLPTP